MHHTGGIVAILLALLCCWLTAQFDPWVGGALAVFVAIAAGVFLIAANEMGAADATRNAPDDSSNDGDE